MTKKIFKTKKEEAEYYDKLDSNDIISLKQAKLDISNVVPTKKSISLRLPVKLIQQVKTKAIKMDIPYQSLIKTYIQKGVEAK